MSNGFGSPAPVSQRSSKGQGLRPAVDAEQVQQQWLSQEAELEDPRGLQGQTHAFLSIVLIAILATIGGATGWEDIEVVGKDREVDLREVLNAIFYRADNGIKWRALPCDFPAWQMVYGYYRLWVRLGVWEQINTALVQQVRETEEREAEPSLVIIDSQSVKLGQKGGRNMALTVTKR